MYILRIVYLHYEVNIVDYMILLTITLDIAYFILYLRYKFIDISVCTVLYAILKSFVASCFWLYYADTWFERSTKKWKWFPSEHSYASPEKGTILNRKIHLQTSSQAFIFRGPSWIFRYTQPKKCEKFLFFPNLGLQKFLPFLHHEYPSEKKKLERTPAKNHQSKMIQLGALDVVLKLLKFLGKPGESSSDVAWRVRWREK